MSLIITLLVILLALVICVYIVQQLPLEPPIKNVALLVVGVIFLIAVLAVILPLIGVQVPHVGN